MSNVTQPDVVYVSDLLRNRHRQLIQELETILCRHATELRELGGTADIWARDYLPIQRHDGVFVSYTYRPDYLRDSPRLQTDWKKVKGLPQARNVEDCDLVLDGGNVVLHDRSAIVTAKLFAENPSLTALEVEDRLRKAFHLTTLIVIPPEPDDVFGHADGMVAWVGQGQVLVNDYRQTAPMFQRELIGLLKKAGIGFTEIPYAPVQSRRRIPPSTGVYTNLLVLPKVVLVPVYGIATDSIALRQIEAQFPDRPTFPIACSSIGLEGGAVHCVTAEEHASRPA